MATNDFTDRDTQDHVRPCSVIEQAMAVLDAASHKEGPLPGECAGLMLMLEKTKDLVSAADDEPDSQDACAAAIDAVAAALSMFEVYDERWGETLIYAIESLLLLVHNQLLQSWRERFVVEVQHG